VYSAAASGTEVSIVIWFLGGAMLGLAARYVIIKVKQPAATPSSVT
jgi:hypothetical protein